MKFAPSTGCFYPDDIAYPEGAVPSDAITATPQDFADWCGSEPGSTIAVVDGVMVVSPPSQPSLDEVKASKVGALNAIYQAALIAPLSLKTAAGAIALFPRDAAHRAMVDLAVAQGDAAWTESIWIDASNAPVAPFTFSDLEALQAALSQPSSPTLMELMGKVAAVEIAEDAAAVDAITF